MLPVANDFALVTIRDDCVMGHAGYYVTSPGKAEAAVVIADSYQSLGLGTILLGQLAEAASTLGISEFELLVVPENGPMINLLSELGFPTLLKVEPGLIRVAFPTSISPEVLEKFDGRDAVAAATALQRFFRPKSVAVIGASREPGSDRRGTLPEHP